VVVFVDVLVHVLVVVDDDPYPSGYGTDIGGIPKASSFSSGVVNLRIHETLL